MTRHFDDWLTAFADYASHGEAPTRMYFWTGVSAVAGALRRRVWIDQKYFQWYPNFYIILVAPPGIVSKSTTADVGMSLLGAVPDIKIGPSVVTWPALIQSFAQCTSSFQVEGSHTPHLMSALTIVSSEFGNLVNPDNREMIDTLVNLWDGKGFTKETKTSGNDNVVNPWLNIIACTTPEWIAGSFPEYMIGGGFTSRCIFVYADKKDKLVAYPEEHVPATHEATKLKLIADLEHLSQRISGPYVLDDAAKVWGRAWYERHYDIDAKKFDPARFGGYVARKQTHMHKLAMVLSASEKDQRVITRENLETAYTMVTDLEREMALVFEKIGIKDEARQALGLLRHIATQGGAIPYKDAFRYLQGAFPLKRDMDEVIQSLHASGQIDLFQSADHGMVVILKEDNGPKAADLPRASVTPIDVMKLGTG